MNRILSVCGFAAHTQNANITDIFGWIPSLPGRVLMKILDQTPYFNEKGEISLVDRGKAIMKFGAGWFKEIEGQNAIIAVLDKALDKKFALLRNITPPGLDTMIPFILVGPTGIYVMSVTAQIGTFRARGDQWGTITGSAFKPDKNNLLTRTDRMARAVQIYLKRQGYTDLNVVEPILLCSDPSTNIDSMRPIIRVVMRDALERFAVSITQARVILTPENVFDIVNRILHPPAQVEPQPEQPAVDGTTTEMAAAEDAPAVAPADQLSYETIPASSGETILPGRTADTEEIPAFISKPLPTQRRKLGIKGINKKQATLLIVMLVFWCLMTAIFIFLIARDYLPLLNQ
jgi:hypothetical protein